MPRLHKRSPYYESGRPSPLKAAGVPNSDMAIKRSGSTKKIVCPYCYSEGWRPITQFRAFCSEGHEFYIR